MKRKFASRMFGLGKQECEYKQNRFVDRSCALWRTVCTALLAPLLLVGCSANYGPYLVRESLRSPEEKMQYLKAARSEYTSQEEWEKALNVCVYYSGSWQCSSAIDCAIMAKDFDIARYLLEEGANPDLKAPLEQGKTKDMDYPIQRAVVLAKSDDEAMKWLTLLFEYGANPNLCTRDRSPALQQAIMKKYPNSVELLLKNGASTRSVAASDPAGINEWQVQNVFKPLPQWSCALNYVVRNSVEGNQADKQMLKTLLAYGADPYDMSVAYSPSLTTYARQMGKPELAQYAIQAYAEVHNLNSKQLAGFKQKLAAHDRQAVAEKKAVENRKLQAANGAQPQFVDDSNSWASTAIEVLKEAPNQHQIAIQQKQAAAQATSSSKAATSQKRVDNSCDNSTMCKGTSYDGPYVFIKTFVGTGKGYNNETACERSRQNASPVNPCSGFVNGKWVYIRGMGVSYSPCEFKELEFKSEARTTATWYCGDPNSSGGGGGVQVE